MNILKKIESINLEDVVVLILRPILSNWAWVLAILVIVFSSYQF